MKLVKLIIILFSIIFFGIVVPVVYFTIKELGKESINIVETKIIKEATTTPETKTETKPIIKQVEPTTKQEITQKKSEQQAQQPEQTTKMVDFETINQSSRSSIVNILCSTKNNGLFPISGTGVMIDPRGIILTNAHIAEFFLLKNFRGENSVECIIRTGSPAYPTYKAELMYISPKWVQNNSTILKDENPKGTGEKDFAFLRITGPVGSNSLPDKFPFVFPNTSEQFYESEPVVLISYPAGFLGGMTILQNLNLTSAITRIQKIYTFQKETADLLLVGGTVVSQKGSSGGAVIDANKSVIGIISTESSGATTTAETNLYAITLAHVDRSIKDETDKSLVEFLSGDPTVTAQDFRDKYEFSLTKILTDALNN